MSCAAALSARMLVCLPRAHGLPLAAQYASVVRPALRRTLLTRQYAALRLASNETADVLSLAQVPGAGNSGSSAARADPVDPSAATLSQARHSAMMMARRACGRVG